MKSVINKLYFEMIKIAHLLAQKDLITGTDGNISAKINEKTILITPSGINKAFLKERDLIIYDIEQNKILNDNKNSKYRINKPTSELPLHVEIYKNNPDIKAVLHTHPFYTVLYSFLIDKYKLPKLNSVLKEIDLLIGEIPISKQESIPGDGDLNSKLVKDIKNNKALILKKHGLITVGKSLTETYNITQSVEYAAKFIIKLLKFNFF